MNKQNKTKPYKQDLKKQKTKNKFAKYKKQEQQNTYTTN